MVTYHKAHTWAIFFIDSSDCKCMIEIYLFSCPYVVLERILCQLQFQTSVDIHEWMPSVVRKDGVTDSHRNNKESRFGM